MVSDRTSIRLAKKADLKAMLNLVRQHQKYDKAFAERYYAKYFKGDEMFEEDEVFVAVLDSKIVGVIGYCRDYLSTDYSYWLGWFMVAPKYQGQGIGTQLLERVERELRRYPSIGRLFVSTEGTNAKATDFYKAHGFEPQGILKSYYAGGEDEMILGKTLRVKSGV